MRATSEDERETHRAPPAERRLARHGARPPKQTLTRRRPRGNDGERPRRGRPNANVSRHPVGGSFAPAAPVRMPLALTAGVHGRYVVIDASGTVAELASFSGSADLSCYTPAEVRRLDRAFRQSETIHGQIAPVAATTVVCGFVDDTTAICWQYSARDRNFVKVGQWVT